MARKYALKAGVANGGFGWALEECEDKLLIAAYTDCQARITTTAWKTDFETHFYNLGSGVTHHSLKMINQNLKRVGQEPVEFVETDIGEYARNPDRETKAKIRGTFRDQYLALDTVGKVRWQNAAREAVSALAQLIQGGDAAWLPERGARISMAPFRIATSGLDCKGAGVGGIG